MPSASLIGRALPVARQGRHQQAFLPQCRPVALSIFKQAVRYRNPERTSAALEPVVEDDACDLTAFARARAVTQKPAPAKADGSSFSLSRRRDEIPCFVDGPGP